MPDPDGKETGGLIPGIPNGSHPHGRGCQDDPGPSVIPDQDRPGVQIYRYRHHRNDTDEFVYAMQIEHRGDAVRAALNKRKNARRNRRSGRPDTEGPNGGTGACQKKIKVLRQQPGRRLAPAQYPERSG